MLELHGRRRSNYFNAVKAILIESEIPFEEVIEPVPPTAAFLTLSPLAKIPCLVTEQGALTETSTIIRFLDSAHPKARLSPADPFACAKQDEIAKFMELYIEWTARRGYGALRGEEISEETKSAVGTALEKSALALSHLTDFEPWACGEEFSWVDTFGYFMFVYAQPSARANADMDLLAAIPGAASWFERVAQRPSVAQVLAESKE